MMAGGPVLDEEERRGYSLVCGFLFRRPHYLSSIYLFLAASFVRLLETSEPPPPPVCPYVIQCICVH